MSVTGACYSKVRDNPIKLIKDLENYNNGMSLERLLLFADVIIRGNFGAKATGENLTGIEFVCMELDDKKFKIDNTNRTLKELDENYEVIETQKPCYLMESLSEDIHTMAIQQFYLELQLKQF